MRLPRLNHRHSFSGAWSTPRNGLNEILAAIKVLLKLTYSYSRLYRGWMFLNGEGTQFIKWRVENKKKMLNKDEKMWKKEEYGKLSCGCKPLG